jgi:hypothetical protein
MTVGVRNEPQHFAVLHAGDVGVRCRSPQQSCHLALTPLWMKVQYFHGNLRGLYGTVTVSPFVTCILNGSNTPEPEGFTV